VAAFLREQRHAQRFLDQLDLVADRRVGQAQLARRIADRLVARRRLEALEGLERRQAPEFDLAADGFTFPCRVEGARISGPDAPVKYSFR
jgi:hypothetical protein